MGVFQLVTDTEGTKKYRRPASPRVTLTLTEEVIVQAEQRDSSHCMWAEALKLAVPTAEHISVDLQTIRYSDKARGLRYSYLTPRKAQISLIRFDQGLHTEPGLTVELRDAQVTKTRSYASRRKRISGVEMPDGRKKELHRGRKDEGHTSIPVVIGGMAPPIGPLSNTTYRGKRRRFGLKILEA